MRMCGDDDLSLKENDRVDTVPYILDLSENELENYLSRDHSFYLEEELAKPCKELRFSLCLKEESVDLVSLNCVDFPRKYKFDATLGDSLMIRAVEWGNVRLINHLWAIRSQYQYGIICPGGISANICFRELVAIL